MRPISERWPKPVLPVDGRPVVATLVRELRRAGCERVIVVTGHLAEQVESLLGDGAGLGVRISYVRQPRPDGSADAVRCALEGGAAAPALVAGADHVFTPGTLARFATDWNGAAGALAARRGGSPVDGRIAPYQSPLWAPRSGGSVLKSCHFSLICQARRMNWRTASVARSRPGWRFGASSCRERAT